MSQSPQLSSKNKHGRVGNRRTQPSAGQVASRARHREVRAARAPKAQESPFLQARAQSRIQQDQHRFVRFVKRALSGRRKPGQTWQDAFEEFQDEAREQQEAEANVISVEEDEDGNLVPASSPWPRQGWS